jgi:hypothetical protein
VTRRFDPASYPGWRPDEPVLVHAGQVEPVQVHAGRVEPTLRAEDRRWVVAYGANACPDRLVDKGLDRRGALLLPARVRGWAAAFEARITSYGAVPLTLVPTGDDRPHDTWVLGLHPDDLPTLDRTEGRVEVAAGVTPVPVHRGGDAVDGPPPGTYRLGRIGEVEVAGGLRLPVGLAYLPGPATSVQVVDGGWRTWPASDQAEARAHVRSGGEHAPAPQPADGDVVTGPWPPTPLRPT